MKRWLRITLLWLLAAAPEWQDRVAAEAAMVLQGDRPDLSAVSRLEGVWFARGHRCRTRSGRSTGNLPAFHRLRQHRPGQ